MSYTGDDTSRQATPTLRLWGVDRVALGLPDQPPLPEVEPTFADYCACGAALVSDSEKGIERCAACDARAYARWSATIRRQADAALTTTCPSLTPELRTELLDAGLRPWDAVKVNAYIRDVWGSSPNRRMDAAARTADLRMGIILLLGGES